MKWARVLAVSVAGVLTLATHPRAMRGDSASAVLEPEGRLAPFIQAVAKAQNPRTAMAAYARGAAVERDNLQLHLAYMKRMLRFGLPQIAVYPARTLVALDPTHALAWGVIGYDQGKRGELDDALVSTLRAVQVLRDDPSLLYNAGELLAWYDLQADPPKIPDALRRVLADLKQDLSRRKGFQQGYQDIKSALEREDRQQGQLQTQMEAAEVAVRTLQQQAFDLDSRLARLNNDMEYRQNLIDALNYDLRNIYGYPFGVRIIDPRPVYHFGGRRRQYWWYGPYSSLLVGGQYLERIGQEQQSVEDVRRQAAGIRQQGQAVMGDLNRKRAELERLRAQASQAGLRLQQTFRWDPPAVEGVVTPELDHVPLGAVKPGDVPSDPSSEAEQRLALAKLYLSNDMGAKSSEILRGIVATYPDTKAAAQAKLMLAALTPGP